MYASSTGSGESMHMSSLTRAFVVVGLNSRYVDLGEEFINGADPYIVLCTCAAWLDVLLSLKLHRLSYSVYSDSADGQVCLSLASHFFIPLFQNVVFGFEC